MRIIVLAVIASFAFASPVVAGSSADAATKTSCSQKSSPAKRKACRHNRRPKPVVTAPVVMPAVTQPAPYVPVPKKTEGDIYVIDNTQGRYGSLDTALQGWDASPYVHVVRTTSCPTSTAAYCVYVSAEQYSAPWLGQTTYLNLQSALIQLDTSYGADDPDYRSSVVCHEFGHAIGVAHPFADSKMVSHGCIAGTDPNDRTSYVSPTSDDLAQVTGIVTGSAMVGPRLGYGMLWFEGLAR